MEEYAVKAYYPNDKNNKLGEKHEVSSRRLVLEKIGNYWKRFH
jgi:hypothetical protein